jgi:hypothetical protein
MRDELRLLNSTGLVLTIFLRSSTTGQGVTGKTNADFAGQWNRGNAASSSLSFASGAVGDTHSSGKIAEIGNGRYYWHVPDTLFTALGQVVATIQVSGAIDIKCEWQVVSVNRESAAFGANTVVPPNVAAFEARTLPTADYATADGVEASSVIGKSLRHTNDTTSESVDVTITVIP